MAYGHRTVPRRRRRPGSQGHPSRGGSTVGGGTGGRRTETYRTPTPTPVPPGGHPTRDLTSVGGGTGGHRLGWYRSKTPSVEEQRRRRRAGPRGRGGHPSQGNLTVGGGTSGHRLGVYVPTAGGGAQVIPLKRYRRLLRQAVVNETARQRDAQRRGYSSYGQLARASVARPVTPQLKEASILGIGEKDIGRFLDRKVIGRQTPLGGFLGGMKDLAEPSFRDLVSLPANVVTGAYYTGKAGLHALPKRIPGGRGDTSEAEQLWKDFKETDPVALAAQGRWGEAGTQAGQHPLLTGLELSGVGSGVSRTAAFGLRHAPSPRLRRIGSTRRPERRVEGTNIVEQRSYSPGLIGKGGQVAAERIRRRLANRSARQSHEAERRGDIDKADELAARARRRSPDKADDRAVEHQVDLLVEGLGQSIRRPGRSETAKAIRQVLPKRGAEIVSLIAQNIVKADRTDLRAYLRELEQEYSGLGASKAKANKRLRAQIEKVLASKKVDMGELEEAARAYAGVLKPLEDEVIAAKMLEAPEAEMAKLKPYAVRNMGARDRGAGLVDENDLPVTSGEIKAHMRERGIDPEGTAFVTHAPGRLGDRAFNVSSRRPQGIPLRRRTGQAVTQGALDTHPERLVEQGVQLRGLADADRTWKRFVSVAFFRDKDHRIVDHDTKDEAAAHARDLEAATGRRWRPVLMSPWAGRSEQLGRLLEDADREGYVGGRHPVSDAMERALAEDAEGPGPWGVVPDAAAQRLADHAAVYRSQGPLARTITQGFRRTVLPLSPSWLTGNAVESAIRTAVRGSGPTSWLTFRRVYNELALGDSSVMRALRPLPAPRRGSPEEQLLHMVPGGHYGGTHDTMVRVSARQFEGSRLRPVADAFAKVYRNPGPGTVARAYGRYADWMFGTFNAGIESQFTRAMAGRYIRKELMDRHRRETNETAIAQGARGMRETPEQVAMADYVRRAYGQYDALPPAMRRWVLTYTPFGMWSWNATKFLFNVLPRDHPMLTGVLAANHQLSEDWRKSHGLDQWADNAVPPFLQGSIPLPGGAHLRVARYTPFGLMADPLTSVASTVLPQYSGALMAMRGLDWKGDPIRGKDGEQLTDPWKLALIGAREFAFGTVPGPGLAARLLEKGPSVLNPLNPVKPREQKESEKSPVDKAIDDALGGSEGDVDDAIDGALDGALGPRSSLAPIRFEAGGPRGARLRNRFFGEARRTNDQIAAVRKFRRVSRRKYRNWLKTPQSRFGDTGRNYLPDSEIPVPHPNDRMLRRGRDIYTRA